MKNLLLKVWAPVKTVLIYIALYLMRITIWTVGTAAVLAVGTVTGALATKFVLFIWKLVY